MPLYKLIHMRRARQKRGFGQALKGKLHARRHESKGRRSRRRRFSTHGLDGTAWVGVAHHAGSTGTAAGPGPAGVRAAAMMLSSLGMVTSTRGLAPAGAAALLGMARAMRRLTGWFSHSLVDLEQAGHGVHYAKSRQASQHGTTRSGRGFGTGRIAVILHFPSSKKVMDS